MTDAIAVGRIYFGNLAEEARPGDWALVVETLQKRAEKAERQLSAARSAFNNIRTMIDGRIDTVDDEDGPQPNIFGQIETQCAVGLGEAP